MYLNNNNKLNMKKIKFKALKKDIWKENYNLTWHLITIKKQM